MAKTTSKITKTNDFNTIDPDTKVRIINNSNSRIHWIQLNGRPINLMKIAAPASLPYVELENMAYTSDLIQTGDIYVPDKKVFDALGIINLKHEDIKLHSELKRMLANLEAEELKEEISKLPDGNKELLAELAIENYDNLRGSVVNTIEDETKVKISLMKEDEKANKENQEKNKK